MIPPQAHRSSRIKRRYAAIVVLGLCEVCLVPAGCGHDQVSRQTAALKDSDVGIRMDAAQKLGELKDPRAVEPLIAALKDSDATVREFAAQALGEIKDPRAIGPLILTFKDSNAEVRGLAAVALEKFGATAVEPLLATLDDKDGQVRLKAAQALRQINDPRPVEILIAALKHSDADARRNAAEALGTIKDPSAVEPLIAALKDGDRSVRNNAARGLGEIKDPRAIGPLIAALKDSDAEVQQTAVEALEEIGPPAAARLAAAWKDPTLALNPQNYSFFLQKGEPGSEEALIRLLYSHGNEEMANAYLNCGNSTLEKVAGKWAKANGYQVMRWLQEGGRVRWGGQ